MAAKKAILFATPGSDADLQLARYIESLGVPCEIQSVEQPGDTRDAGVILSGSALARLLAANRERSLSLLQTASSALLFGLESATLTADDLQFVTGGVCDRSGPISAAAFNVKRDPELCGPLAGLTVPRQASGPVAGLKFAGGAGAVELICVDNTAIFGCLKGSRIFLSASGKIGLDEALAENFRASAVLEWLAPILLYVRAAFPEVRWKPRRNMGCLIIDDPMLRPRYGFLNLLQLLSKLEESNSAANLAFIPFNWKRSRKSVADLVRKNTRMAICIHGCDHTRAEYGSSNGAWLDALTTLALQRMQGHQESTGVPHERIMVFPQGIFSAEAMATLKNHNFVAVVNTEVVPNHQTRSGSIRLRELLSVAADCYSGFPLFSRRNYDADLADFAIDMLLGKPTLIVAHHQFFQSGFGPFLQLASDLNRLDPQLQWRPLGEVIENACLWRFQPDGTVAVKMFANQMQLQNDSAARTRYRIEKSESDLGAVSEVLINGQPQSFERAGADLRVCCELASGESALVRVLYREPKRNGAATFSLKYRAQSAARRYMCDFRDGYVQPLQRLVLGAR